MTKHVLLAPAFGKWDTVLRIWINGEKLEIRQSESCGPLHGILLTTEGDATTATEIRGSDQIPACTLLGDGR